MSNMSFKDDLNELNESLKELNETLEDGQSTLAQGSALSITDEGTLARKYLSSLAQERLSTKSTTIIVQERGTMKAYMAIYLCTRVRNDNIEKGVEALSGVLNVLAEKGYIHSCLAPMSSLQLAIMPMQHPSSVVLCFPLVPADKVDEIKQIAGNLMTSESGVGECLDTIDKELPEGQFYAEIRVSHGLTTLKSFSVEDALKEQIQEHLKVLPKGTEVISVNQCAIIGLFISYEVIFYNPLMKSIKEVKLYHIRFAEVVDNHLEQFNLFKSVEYIKRDGTTI